MRKSNILMISADMHMLTIIKTYSGTKLNNIIISTGATIQLESIAQLYNSISYDEYSNHCIDTLFSYVIFLTTNKRLKSDEDKQGIETI